MIEGGIDGTPFDAQRKGRPDEITDDAVAWITNVAFQRLASFPRLATMTKSMLQKILQKSDIKPFKIKYYCEKRDPNFETKMHDVLLVYKQIYLQFDENEKLIIPEDAPMVHTVSCDEKPDIQAIATTRDDLHLTMGNGSVYWDAEYKQIICSSIPMFLLFRVSMMLSIEQYISCPFALRNPPAIF